MLLTRSPLIHPASWASSFDLHVLSTPPAFILSQDQTLHKNVSAETGREKPKTQPKTHQPTPHNAVPDWHNPKITKVQTQPTPTRRGKTGPIKKHIRETCSTTPHAHHEPKQMTRSVIGIQPRHHRHTPKNRHTPTQCTTRQANTPTQQKYIGTLSSSQTTPAHPNQPTHAGKSKVTKVFSSAIVFLPATQTREHHLALQRGVVGLADSI